MIEWLLYMNEDKLAKHIPSLEIGIHTDGVLHKIIRRFNVVVYSAFNASPTKMHPACSVLEH